LIKKFLFIFILLGFGFMNFPLNNWEKIVGGVAILGCVGMLGWVLKSQVQVHESILITRSVQDVFTFLSKTDTNTKSLQPLITETKILESVTDSHDRLVQITSESIEVKKSHYYL
jgi:hypothetical protein